MKAKYKMIIELELNFEVDEIKDLKSDREMAEDICNFIADEATNCEGVTTYNIKESSIEVN